jgi:putative tRNA adenosine deaminase-associated protein
VPYFTAVVARESRRWVAHDLDLDSIEDLGELAGELRDVVDDEDEPVLLLVEREDAWWGVLRVDGEDDPRVFVSDAVGAAASSYASVLELAADDDEEDDVVRQGACAGDFDVLADLGTSPEALREMCDEEVPPMDALATVAERAGFAEVLDSLR